MDDIARRFLQSEFSTLSLGGAFQRAGIYAKDSETETAGRKRLRDHLRVLLDQSLERYGKPVSDDQHMSFLRELSDSLSDRHGRILDGGRFRLGIAQKATNLFLKYCWCAGWIPEPPHCPFDRVVIEQLPGMRHILWTRLDQPDEYMSLVIAARDRAGPRSLAAWELELWSASSTERGLADK